MTNCNHKLPIYIFNFKKQIENEFYYLFEKKKIEEEEDRRRRKKKKRRRTTNTTITKKRKEEEVTLRCVNNYNNLSFDIKI